LRFDALTEKRVLYKIYKLKKSGHPIQLNPRDLSGGGDQGA
jgi:hypothetical protein